MGIMPQRAPITRHFIPICKDVQYTHIIPFQKSKAFRHFQYSPRTPWQPRRSSERHSFQRDPKEGVFC